MARTREQISETYRNAMEAAEAWRDTDPARFAQLREAALNARADALEELANQSDRERDAERLSRARAEAKQKYPYAVEASIHGNTPEEIEASAKASHDGIAKAREEAAAEARGQSRASRAQRYGQGPGSNAGEQRPRVDEQARETAGHLAALSRDAERTGDERGDNPLAGKEIDTLRAMRASGRGVGLSFEALAGIAPATGGEEASEEDLRG